MAEKLTILVLGAVAGLAGGLLAGTLKAEKPVARAAAPRETPRQAVPQEDYGPALDGIKRRLVALEAWQVARNVQPPERDTTRTAAPTRREPAKKKAAPLEGLLGKPFTNASSDKLFARLASQRGKITDMIAELKEAIEKDPKNADLWTALATALGAKTAYATPGGPEQGKVWAETIKAYDEAIRLDPNHWQARYGKAFGNSMAPEFVGLRPAAIRDFEELIDIQERQAPEKTHVLAYKRLGTLYKDAGNVTKAEAMWKRGLKRFPDAKQLRDAVELVEKSDG